MDQKRIFKVVSAKVWSDAESTGRFVGAPIDLADGYIHFSTAAQLKETVQKHFAGQLDLVIVGFDPDQLGDDLRWEPSRGGELFPHLYGDFATATAVSIDDLPVGKDGQHIFPAMIDD